MPSLVSLVAAIFFAWKDRDLKEAVYQGVGAGSQQFFFLQMLGYLLNLDYTNDTLGVACDKNVGLLVIKYPPLCIPFRKSKLPSKKSTNTS